MDELKARVKPAQKRIVLPENDSDRALKAAAIVTKEGFAKIVLVGDPAKLQKDADRLASALTVYKSSTLQPMKKWTNCALTLQNGERKRA